MLGDNIKKIREELGFSIGDLSKKTGISDNIIKEYENNNKIPCSDTLNSISKAMDIKVSYIIRPELATRIGKLLEVENLLKNGLDEIILYAFNKEYISESKAAELMNIPLELFRILGNKK